MKGQAKTYGEWLEKQAKRTAQSAPRAQSKPPVSSKTAPEVQPKPKSPSRTSHGLEREEQTGTRSGLSRSEPSSRPVSSTGTHSDFPPLITGNSLNYNDKTIAAVAERLGVTENKAKKTVKSINTFTGGGYQEFRRKDKLDKPDSDVKRINEFLNAAPKFQGSTYRGLRIKNSELTTFLESSARGIKLDAMSSFSSDQTQAKMFASTGGDVTQTGVLLKVKSNRSGVSIRSFSKFPDEKEVLTPKGTKYRAVKKSFSKAKNMYILELEEI